MKPNHPVFFVLVLLNLTTPCLAIETEQPAPSCTTTTAKPVLDANQFKGKVTLVDFWATWCPPCVKSIPFFNGIHHELKEKGLQIIAINVDEEPKAAEAFLTSHPIDYSVSFDPEGLCPKTYDLKAMPSSYLIDKSGKVRKVFLGYRDEDQAQLKDQIGKLLAEQ